MPKYKIVYKDSEDEEEESTIEVEVEAKNDLWAEDIAYSLADKGWYKVFVEVEGKKQSVIETAPRMFWKEAFDCYTSNNRKFKMVDDFYVPT